MASRRSGVLRPPDTSAECHRPRPACLIFRARQNVFFDAAAARSTSIPPFVPARAAQTVKPRRLSPTEQRHPRSMNLDKLPVHKAIKLMLSEDAKVAKKLLKESGQIEAAIQAIVRSFRRGGRLFYVGAGTSGRLGVLDASECPATFRTPPELVQGIIAGGPPAISKAVEGAEDDHRGGAKAIVSRRISRRDVGIGIAASGTTP